MTVWQSLVESQIFYPERAFWARPADLGLAAADVWPRSGGHRLHGWHFAAPDAQTLLLFCHGNAGNISHRLENIKLLLDAGLAVLIFDYRGYGQSQGSPSEAGLYADTLAAWDEAAALARAAGQRLVLFGRSLGGVAAVHAAAHRPAPGVILESTFTNLADMAEVHFPLPMPRAWLARRFDSLGRIGQVRAPKLFFHGDRDAIVPMKLGRQLYEAAPEPKAWETLRGAGHNDTYERGGQAYFRRIAQFCAGLPPAAP